MRTPSSANSNVTPIRRNRASSPAHNDAALMRRVATGERTAMRIVFLHHHLAVYRFALHRLRDKALAEDVTCDAFLDVWRYAARFDGRSTALTWILAIARRKTEAARLPPGQLSFDGNQAETDRDGAGALNAISQMRNRGKVLRDCLAALPAEQREVIDLAYCQEQSVAAVAAILGIPENTVRTRMFQARRRLADELKRRGLDATSK
jgi:RNA polymerase sigma-70 factor (ECF subfamily)